MSQPSNYDPTRPDVDPDDMRRHDFLEPGHAHHDPNRVANFRIGQSYADRPADTVACTRCGSVEFHVAQGHYFTAVRCPNCKWEYCIHDG
jgi:ribosomal protein S27E